MNPQNHGRFLQCLNDEQINHLPPSPPHITMTHREENKEKAAVPVFGAWDQKAAAGGEFTGYSVVFTKAREKRKQTKVEAPPPIDLSNQDGLGHAHDHAEAHHHKHGSRPHHHLPHRRRHSNSKAPDQSTNKEEPNKGMKKLLQCIGGGGCSKD